MAYEVKRHPIRCLTCGKDVLAQKKEAKYCSRECLYVAVKGKPRPEAARKMLEVAHKLKRENPEKYNAIAIRNLPKHAKGSTHPNWKGGLTTTKRDFNKLYGSKLYKLKQKLLEICGGKCVDCGSETHLEMHHIVPITLTKEFAFEQSNCVILCKSCHLKAHGGNYRNANINVIGTGEFIIKFIPHRWHNWTTIGHWAFGPDGGLLILVSEEISFPNKIAVIFHELIEAAMCRSKGITTAECDAFDELFEQEYADGKWPISVEAGNDPRCPYRNGHVWGTHFERLVIFLLGADKKELDAECDRLMGITKG